MSPFDPRDPLGFRYLVEALRQLCVNEQRQARFIVFMSVLLVAVSPLVVVLRKPAGLWVMILLATVYLMVLLAMKPPPKIR